MNSNNIIPILGMHRSGTSLLASWLQSCGLNIGNQLLGSNYESNKKGHFEDVYFLNLHSSFLEKRHLPYSISTEDKFHLTKIEIKEIEQLLKSKCKNNEVWSWKEPRTCLFLDTYKELLPNCFSIVVYRDYHEVVRSMFMREFKMWKNHPLPFKTRRYLSLYFHKSKLLNQYLASWNLHNQNLLDFIYDNENFIVINQKDIVNNSKLILKKIKEHVPNANLKYSSIDNIFSKKLLSHSSLRFKFNKKIEKEAQTIYSQLENKNLMNQ